MDLAQFFEQILGLGEEPRHLTNLQVCARSAVIFIYAVLLVRISARRFLAHKSAFDVILAFILGSMLSRAINGSAPFVPTLAGSLVLVLIHRLIALISFHSHGFGNLVKGRTADILINGEYQREAMRRNHITEHDLLEDLRLNNEEDPKKVKLARLERSGDISVVPS